MSDSVRWFPPHPIRGVLAVHTRQTSCPGRYALVIVDFEPGPLSPSLQLEVADGLTVTGGLPNEGLSLDYLVALADGIRTELGDRGLVLAGKVVLRQVRLHAVDSDESAFREAGRVAVRQAVAAFGPIGGSRETQMGSDN